MTRMLCYLFSRSGVCRSAARRALVARGAGLVAPGDSARAIVLHMFVQLIVGGEGAFVGEFRGVFDGCARALGVRAQIFVARQARLFQRRLEHLDRVAGGLPLRLFVARAIARRVGHRVATVAIADPSISVGPLPVRAVSAACSTAWR